MSYGFASFMGLGKETTWGTPVSAASWFEAMSESLITNLDRFETRAMTGRYTEADDSTGLERNQGDFVAAVNPANIGHVLRGVFGVNSVSNIVSGSFYLNEFTPAQADFSNVAPLPPYTLEIFRAGTSVNSSFLYDGCQFSRLQLGFGINAALMATVGVMARAQTLITKSTPSFPGSPVEPFLFSTVSLQLPGGTANTRIEALQITYDNNLEMIGTFNNSNYIGHMKRTAPPTVRISGTISFLDFTEFLDFKNQTERRFVASLFKANSFHMAIDIPRMVYRAVPISVPGAQRITSSFEGMARYHTGSGNAMKVSLSTVNTF